MTKKLMMIVVTAALGVATVAFADPVVTDITAKQRYPWNGLVDIACKVSGIEADAGGYEFAVVAVDKGTGKEYTVSNFSVKHSGEDVSGLDVYENGDYSLFWNAREDMGQVIFERMTVRITLEAVAEEEVVEDENLDTRQKVQLWAGGPYWADRNIGASKPWKYGSYFWWGDTKGHRPSGGTFSFSFDSSNCPTYGLRTDRVFQTTLQSEGWMVWGTSVLASKHDAAHVKWGGAWRMPTHQELDALNSNCDWAWTTRNGVNGYIVRGRGAYASNSIFLPCSGYGDGASLYDSGSCGHYWSSNPNGDNFTYGRYAYDLYFWSRSHSCDNYNNRYCGRSVRPVQGFTN